HDARSSLLRSTQLAASPLGGLTPADVPLIEAEILSEQPGPPHFGLILESYREDSRNRGSRND
ncbi:MAG: hypothetical protein WCD20_08605, partial [Rhodomicrobium sp.]